MTTSGTVSTTVFKTRAVIDRAFGRCKLKPEQISSEYQNIARENLYLILSQLANKGIPLWCVEKIICPLYQGQAAITLPLGTVSAMNSNYRSLTRLTGTYTSSAGGTVANAFDDDFATVLTQTSALGNVQVQFTSSTQVTFVGWLPNATATLSLSFQRSTDAVTWTTIYAPGSTAYTAGTWVWYDLDGSIADSYFRVVALSGTINVREIFVGNTPAETPLGRLNQDDYTNLPNKTFEGRPLQFFMNRLRGTTDALPIMYTWPVCDLANRYGQITVWRQRYIQDVGTLAEELDIPQRWYMAIIAELAVELAGEIPEVTDALELKLMGKARTAWQEAQSEERDDSPFTITAQIGAYTR